MAALPIRVLIADDHPLMRSGLRGLLEREGEFKVVAEAPDGYEAIELALMHKPDVILLDVGMPRLNGTDAAARVSEKLPAARIVMLSMHSDEAYVLKALSRRELSDCNKISVAIKPFLA
jgi:DNA-binding NarL/FixJ family response regulator